MRKISSGARTDASRRDTTNDFVAAPPVPAAQTAADPLPSPSSSTPTGLAAASHDAPLLALAPAGVAPPPAKEPFSASPEKAEVHELEKLIASGPPSARARTPS